MTFNEAKDVAALIGNGIDQLVTVSLLVLTGSVSLLIKYWTKMRAASRASALVGIAIICVSLFYSYVNKGILVTKLLNHTVPGHVSNPTDFSEASMFAFLQFCALLFGAVVISVGFFISRNEIFRPDTRDADNQSLRLRGLLAILRKSKMTIATALLLLSMTPDSFAQSLQTNSDILLRQVAADFGNPQRRAALAGGIIAIAGMDMSYGNTRIDPIEMGRLLDLLLFMQNLSPDRFVSRIEAAKDDFAKTLPRFNRFAVQSGLARNGPLYDDLVKSLAAATVITKVPGAPLFFESICNSFFFQWICNKF